MDDGDGAVFHGIHLIKAAGFKSTGHDEEVAGSFYLVGKLFVVADMDGNFGGEFFLKRRK